MRFTGSGFRLKLSGSCLKASKVSDEQEKQVFDMLQSLTKDEGVKIKLDEGENMTSLKACILNIAKSEGISVTVKMAKKKWLMFVWRT